MSNLTPTPCSPDVPSSVIPLFVTARLVVYPKSLQLLRWDDVTHGPLLHASARADQTLVLGNTNAEFTAGAAGDSCPVHPIATLARITQQVPVGAGKRIVVLQGLRRVQVLSEERSPSSLRMVRVKPRDEIQIANPVIDRQHRCRELLDATSKLLKEGWQQRLLEQVSIRLADLGDLCDLLSQSLPLSMECHHRLLSELDVDERSELLQESLRRMIRTRQSSPQTFPPRFGAN